MAVGTLFEIFPEDLAKKVHDLMGTAGVDADTLKLYLTNATPDAAADAVKADLAEIATGNGYAGAVSCQNAGVRAAAVVTVTATNITITASGGAIATFRYAAVFNDTAAGDPLIGFWDYGSPLTLNEGESIVFKFNNGVASGTLLTISG